MRRNTAEGLVPPAEKGLSVLLYSRKLFFSGGHLCLQHPEPRAMRSCSAQGAPNSREQRTRTDISGAKPRGAGPSVPENGNSQMAQKAKKRIATGTEHGDIKVPMLWWESGVVERNTARARKGLKEQQVRGCSHRLLRGKTAK